MIYFVGAGSGAPDLITVRGLRLLKEADVLIYAGSLVNPELLEEAKEGCLILNSARMTLPEVLSAMEQAERERKTTVRLHSGDPSIYGAIREQSDFLDSRGIRWEVCPGVSSFCAAAACLGAELTLPGVSQSVIITRLAGRTDVPKRENFRSLASHQATMAVFLSAGMTKELETELLEAGYAGDTQAAIVYKATWPEEKRILCTVATLHEAALREGIERTAMILVGDVLGMREENGYENSRLYAPEFTTGYRKGGI